MTATIERSASRTGKPRYRTVEGGKTFEAHVGARGDFLHIRGPMENRRPHKALYNLTFGDVEAWPGFYGMSAAAKTRKDRFNTAAWRLIDAANEDIEMFS